MFNMPLALRGPRPRPSTKTPFFALSRVFVLVHTLTMEPWSLGLSGLVDFKFHYIQSPSTHRTNLIFIRCPPQSYAFNNSVCVWFTKRNATSSIVSNITSPNCGPIFVVVPKMHSLNSARLVSSAPRTAMVEDSCVCVFLI